MVSQLEDLSIPTYGEMLERALSQVRGRVKRVERFEIPVAHSFVVGSRTIVTNFKDICERINRKPGELAKFLFKELASGGGIEGHRLILIGKFKEGQINSALTYYVNKYVICPVCKAPDTKLLRKKKALMLKCLACGAISPVPEYR